MKGVDPSRRSRELLLGFWFFLTIANLWLLKPVRTASLIAHLGAAETPWVRLLSAAVVGVVVLLYSRVADRASRVSIAIGTNTVCAATLFLVWSLLAIFGETLGRLRGFVYFLYVLVDVYAVVIVGIFWTYANDVMTPDEADASYAPIGLGGILGGAAGGVIADLLAKPVGPENLLLGCAMLSLACSACAARHEHRWKPRPRSERVSAEGLDSALEGIRRVAASPYLKLVAAIVIAYEFTATLTDFAVNVVFERTFSDRATLAKMYGRLGWIASGTAVACQLFVVPLLLPRKRVALLVPPVVMGLATIALMAAPALALAILLTAADRGLNYSLQQVTKETLYVPLNDVEKYKAKAAIDMIIDRGAKGVAAIILALVLARHGDALGLTLAIALLSIAAWALAGARLGRMYDALRGGAREPLDARTSSTSVPP